MWASMPNTLIPHPTNGTNHFGLVLQKTSRGVIIPGGPIVLKRGRYGSGGFGAAHIWQRHEREMRKAGFLTETEVVLYVASIICPGSALYCEFERIRDTRLTVVRGVVGTAILEHKPHDPQGPCYSVVTAYGAKNPSGTRIGKVEAVPQPAPMVVPQAPENETPAGS